MSHSARRPLCGLHTLLALLAIGTTFGVRSAAAADIENLFLKQDDLSGKYTISKGTTPGSDKTYGGSVTIGKPKVVVTPRGTKINVYHLTWDFGDKPVPGVAVQAGDRLYTAYGRYKKYGLVFWCKFDMPEEAVDALNKQRSWDAMAKPGHYYTWKGKWPWFGSLSPETNAYGFVFHIDGSWGLARGTSFTYPMEGAYEHASVGELTDKGKDNSTKGWEEAFTLTVESHGENVILHYKDRHDPEYTGTGMRITDELVFGSWGGTSNAGGVGYYDFVGKHLVGTYASDGGEARGVEVLDVPDDVVARNPAVFK